ncbi:MAG: hypothetical protein K6F76_02655 [Clostridiales bacterium]|nr:hypothetical protein [Clostridiales bacterium]
MAAKRRNKYFLVYIMIIVFLVSFFATVGIGKLLDPQKTPAVYSDSEDASVVSYTFTQSDTESDTQTDALSDSDFDNTESDTVDTESDTQGNQIPDDQQPEQLTQMLKDGGVKYSDIKGKQLILVSTNSVYANVYCYEKQSNGEWKEKYNYSDGYIGYWGVAASPAQNSQNTPSGLFGIGEAFGFGESVDTKLDYFEIKTDTYWVTDKNSDKYNTHVEGNDGSWSGAVSMYDEAYTYGAVIENTGSVAGVFLCCGTECTSRDVAMSEEHIKEVLSWLDKSCSPQILIY